VSPATIWPPNGAMVSIAPTFTVHDNCDAAPAVTIASATSTTAAPADISVTPPTGASVRAFRAGTEKNGRTYTLTYSAVDASGNTSSASASVLVPHDKR